MLMGKYILEGREPVPCEDLFKWGAWFESAKRHVADDTIGDVRVSTVFLALDHSFREGRPQLFETMVFGGPLDGLCERYATWDEAEQGHRAVLAQIKG